VLNVATEHTMHCDWRMGIVEMVARTFDYDEATIADFGETMNATIGCT
jgi:hypothetical protein